MKEGLIPIQQEVPTHRKLMLIYAFDHERNIFVPIEKFARGRREIVEGVFQLLVDSNEFKNREILHIRVTSKNRIFAYRGNGREIESIFDENGNVKSGVPLRVFNNRRDFYEWLRQSAIHIENFPWRPKGREFREIFI